MPYCARSGRTCHAICGGRNRNSSVDPSSGGTGIRLKIASSDVEHHEVVTRSAPAIPGSADVPVASERAG